MFVIQVVFLLTNGNIIVDGVAIDATKKCNDTKCLQLSDQIGHGGTVINGLIANLVVENINSAYNTNISLFSECQILANAGIKPLSECGSVPLSPTPDAEATITPSVTPTNRVQLTGTTTPINTPTGTTVPGGTNTPIPSQTPVAPTNTTVPTTPGATSLPQPTPTIQPTNLPQPTPGVGIACGKADVNNDGKFTLVDFRDFAKIYQRECNDGHLDYGECGHKDSDRNGKIEIRDFQSFAGRYYPRESCSL